MKRFLLLLLFVIANAQAYSEEPEPLSFFPHHVGDTWIYRYSQAYTDSLVIRAVQPDGVDTAIYYNKNLMPMYILDINANVYYSTQSTPPVLFLDYKLSAIKGESWIVETDTHTIGTSIYARVNDVYQAFVFGELVTVKEIAYFRVPNPDTTITDRSSYAYTHLLASGIGFIREIGESGDVPIDLVGCIIDGDTLGVVTGVEDKQVDGVLSVNVVPNPCTSVATLRFTLPVGVASVHIEMTDLFGRAVYTSDIHTDSCIINTSAFSNGIYFCRITAGTQTATETIIVQR